MYDNAAYSRRSDDTSRKVQRETVTVLRYSRECYSRSTRELIRMRERKFASEMQFRAAQCGARGVVRAQNANVLLIKRFDRA